MQCNYIACKCFLHCIFTLHVNVFTCNVKTCIYIHTCAAVSTNDRVCTHLYLKIHVLHIVLILECRVPQSDNVAHVKLWRLTIMLHVEWVLNLIINGSAQPHASVLMHTIVAASSEHPQMEIIPYKRISHLYTHRVFSSCINKLRHLSTSNIKWNWVRGMNKFVNN